MRVVGTPSTLPAKIAADCSRLQLLGRTAQPSCRPRQRAPVRQRRLDDHRPALDSPSAENGTIWESSRGFQSISQDSTSKRLGIGNAVAGRRKLLVVHRRPPCSAHTRHILGIVSTLRLVSKFAEYVPSMRLDAGITAEGLPSCQIEAAALAPPSL